MTPSTNVTGITPMLRAKILGVYLAHNRLLIFYLLLTLYLLAAVLIQFFSNGKGRYPIVALDAQLSLLLPQTHLLTSPPCSLNLVHVFRPPLASLPKPNSTTHLILPAQLLRRMMNVVQILGRQISC